MKAKTPWNKRSRRVGRGPGSGRGKRSGRGQKGCGARSGWYERWGFEGGQNPYYLRFPKRGFNRAVKRKFDVVNLDTLASWGEERIDIESFRTRGLLKAKNDGIKVLGRGELKKPLVVEAHAFSESAKKQIEKAGGKAIAVAIKEQPSR